MGVWGWEILLGQVPVWGATYLQFQPWWSAVGAAYREGRLPLWNPHAGFGAPLLANPQAAALSPFALLTIILPAEQALAFSLLGHALVAALGAWLAARRLGASPLGACLAGIVFPLSGAMASWAVFPAYFATASWLPLAFAAGFGNRRGLPIGPALILALAWFDGHPQAWLMVAIGAITGGLAGRDWPGNRIERLWRFPLRAVRFAGPLFALTVPLIAIQLVPAIELFLQSVRSGGIDGRVAASLDPPLIGFLLLLLPDLFGLPASGDYAGPAGIWNLAWFAGTATLPLAIAGFRQPRAQPLVALLLISVAFAFAPGLPVVGSIGRTLAGGELLRGSGRFLLLADFSLAILAGLGVTHLLGAAPAAIRRLGWRTVAVGTGIAAGGFAGLAVGGELFQRAGFLLVLAGILIVGSRLTLPDSRYLAGAALTSAARILPVVAIVASVAVELLIWSRPLLPLGDAAWYADTSPPLTRFIADDVFLREFFEVFPLSRYGRAAPDPRGAALLPNRATVGGGEGGCGRVGVWECGQRDVPSYDPLRPALEQQVVSAAGRSSTALARLGIGEEVAERGRLNPIPSPRARVTFVSRAVVESDTRAALGTLFDPGFPADETVILATLPPSASVDPVGELPFALSGTVAPERLTIVVDSRTAGYLRILDLDYPGWQATVNGAPAPIVNADVAFRAVPISAGRHAVVLEYRPISVLAGGTISAIAWIALLTLLARRRFSQSDRSDGSD